MTEYRTQLRVDDRMIAIRTQKKTSPSGPITQTTLRYAHTDHLGSIVALSDASGYLVDRDDFDAWGKRRPVAAGTQELLTVAPSYTGHRALDDIQLVHMGGRVYDPVLGRFLSPDPYVQFPTDTQGLNRYTYVLNNPLSYTDPTGYNLFSRIGRWFDRLFSKIGRWTRSFMKKYGSYVAMAAVFVPPAWPGAAAAAAAIAAGASGLQVAFNGGSLEQILFAGAIAGLGAWTGAETGLAPGVIVNNGGGSFWKALLRGMWFEQSAQAGTIVAGSTEGKRENHEAFVWPAAGAAAAVAARAAIGATAAAPMAAATIAGGIILYPSGLGDSTLNRELEPFFNHYTNEVGRAGIMRAGTITPSEDGFVYVTPTAYESGLTAQSELALSRTPTGYFQIPRSNLPGLTPLGRVPPSNGQPGGGTQFVVPGPVSINGARWVPVGR